LTLGVRFLGRDSSVVFVTAGSWIGYIARPLEIDQQVIFQVCWNTTTAPCYILNIPRSKSAIEMLMVVCFGG
jgi:hypothetical protein